MNNEKSERDSSLERLLRDTLRAQVSDPSDIVTERCLDAETLAAWAEQTLGARERSLAEAHAADCARCQAMLAAMIRTAPPVVEAPWWRVHMMAWMVPMTAGAAALIVWLALPMRSVIEPPRANATRAIQEQPAAAPQLSARAETPASALTAPPAAVEAPKRKEADESQAKKDAVRDMRGRTASLDQSAGLREEFRRADAPPPAPEEKRETSALAKSEPAPAQPSANAVGEARAKAMAESIAAAQPPPPPTPASPPAPAPAAAAAAQERSTAAAPRAVASRLAADQVTRQVVAAAEPIVSPNPLNRWRLLPGGVVQRSTDGGTTWHAQQTGATTTLTAGASPSPLVCWVVGSRGRVLLSTDGATWKPVPLSEPIDLVSVTATDDKTATVTASDGRTFVTADGGATWRPR